MFGEISKSYEGLIALLSALQLLVMLLTHLEVRKNRIDWEKK